MRSSLTFIFCARLVASQKGEQYECGTWQLISGLPCCANPEYKNFQPWWLQNPHTYATPVAQTALPIVILDTHDANPSCGAKVDADIKIIYDVNGGLNNLAGEVVQTFPRSSTRVRLAGQSSLGYKKKQFNIYNKPDASILDFPAQEDYRLHAPVSDASALKNWLVYNLDRCNGGWSPRARFVRAYLVASQSGAVAPQDMGLYMLMEKVGRDGQKLDVDSRKCATAPNCGYVLEIDRNCVQGKEGACLSPESCIASQVEIKYPGTPTTEQRCFLQRHLRQMCRAADVASGGNQTSEPAACTSSGNCATTGCCTAPGHKCYMKNQYWGACRTDCTPGIHLDEPPEHQTPWSCEEPCPAERDPDASTDLYDYIDAESFYNQFVYTQLSMNVDAYVSSEFFHKHRDGKLRAGPQWDFNGAFGSNYEFQAVIDAVGRDPREPDFGWIRDGSSTATKTTGTLEKALGWSQFLKSQKFVNGLICHYKNLRQFNMTDGRLMSIIDAGHAFLQLEGAADSFLTDIDQHVQKLKAFVKSRVAWMDANIDTYALGLQGSCPEYTPPSMSELLGSCQTPSVSDPIRLATRRLDRLQGQTTPQMTPKSTARPTPKSDADNIDPDAASASQKMHLISGVLGLVLLGQAGCWWSA